MYECKHFDIKEFVSEETYQARGELCWRFFNPYLLRSADILREIYGQMIINTWSLSDSVQQAYGNRTESGLRTPAMENYSQYSSHSHANAFDALFRDVTAEEVRHDIITHKIELPAPVILECTIKGKQISWLHLATGNVDEITELHL